MSMQEANSLCSFVATLPETKMPRWPMVWCTEYTIVWPELHEVVIAVVEVEHPAQRLRRRGDLVAPGAEHDDGRRIVAQVDALAVGGGDQPLRQLVADEEIVGDPLHLPAR